MGKRRALTIIAAVVLTVFVVGAVLVAVLGRSSESRLTLPAGIDTLTVRSERGSVAVDAGVGASGIDVDSRWILSEPEVSVAAEGDEAVVEVTCPGWAFASCSADLVIRVPAQVRLDVKTVRGALTVDGVRGETTAISEDGDVRVAGGASRVTARSVTGAVEVRTDTPPGALMMRSETGDVTAEVPAGDYALDLRSAEGTVTVVGLRDRPGASGSIEASSGLGSVTVRARGAAGGTPAP